MKQIVQSFTSSATVAYAVSISWVIRYHRLRDRRTEYAGFVALGLPRRALNAGVPSGLLRYSGVDYLWAKCAAAVTTFLWNFFARRQFPFLHK
jgi:hypothetical protein